MAEISETLRKAHAAFRTSDHHHATARQTSLADLKGFEFNAIGDLGGAVSSRAIHRTARGGVEGAREGQGYSSTSRDDGGLVGVSRIAEIESEASGQAYEYISSGSLTVPKSAVSWDPRRAVAEPPFTLAVFRTIVTPWSRCHRIAVGIIDDVVSELAR